MVPWIIIKNSGKVEAAHCLCMAGLGECCSHVGAVLFYLHHAYNMKCTKSVTDVYAYWGTPSHENANPSKIRDINFNHPENMNTNYFTQFSFNLKSKTRFIKKLSVTLNDTNKFNTFLSKLEAINSEASI